MGLNKTFARLKLKKLEGAGKLRGTHGKYLTQQWESGWRGHSAGRDREAHSSCSSGSLEMVRLCEERLVRCE